MKLMCLTIFVSLIFFACVTGSDNRDTNTMQELSLPIVKDTFIPSNTLPIKEREKRGGRNSYWENSHSQVRYDEDTNQYDHDSDSYLYEHDSYGSDLDANEVYESDLEDDHYSDLEDYDVIDNDLDSYGTDDGGYSLSDYSDREDYSYSDDEYNMFSDSEYIDETDSELDYDYYDSDDDGEDTESWYRKRREALESRSVCGSEAEVNLIKKLNSAKQTYMYLVRRISEYRKSCTKPVSHKQQPTVIKHKQQQPPAIKPKTKPIENTPTQKEKIVVGVSTKKKLLPSKQNDLPICEI